MFPENELMPAHIARVSGNAAFTKGDLQQVCSFAQAACNLISTHLILSACEREPDSCRGCAAHVALSNLLSLERVAGR